MAEYIDREALLDELCRDNCERTYDGTCHNCRMTDTIADFPAADVEPVVQGKWILGRELDGTPYCFHCSVCDDDFHYIGIMAAPDYCPNCGAKMDKEE